jgi:hypothetical protein
MHMSKCSDRNQERNCIPPVLTAKMVFSIQYIRKQRLESQTEAGEATTYILHIHTDAIQSHFHKLVCVIMGLLMKSKHPLRRQRCHLHEGRIKINQRVSTSSALVDLLSHD